MCQFSLPPKTSSSKKTKLSSILPLFDFFQFCSLNLSHHYLHIINIFSFFSPLFLTTFLNLAAAYHNVLEKLRSQIACHEDHQHQEDQGAYRIMFEEPVEKYSRAESHKGKEEKEEEARKTTLAWKSLEESYGVDEDRGAQKMDLLWEIFYEADLNRELGRFETDSKGKSGDSTLYNNQDDLKFSIRKMMSLGMRSLKRMKISKAIKGLHQFTKHGSKKLQTIKLN